MENQRGNLGPGDISKSFGLVSMGPGFHSEFYRQKIEVIIIIIRELIHGKGNLAFPGPADARCKSLLSKFAL